LLHMRQYKLRGLGCVFVFASEGVSPSPHESLESAGSHEIPRKIRMAKKLDIKIRETKELAANGLISVRLSRPAPSLRG